VVGWGVASDLLSRPHCAKHGTWEYVAWSKVSERLVAVRKSETQPIPRMLDRKLHEYRSAAGGSMNHSSDYVHADLTVLERRVCICGWPTDTISIDFNGRNYNYATSENKTASITHTLLLFIPGNPGVIQWYTLFLTQIVQKLGRGFAVRGLSYAGHGVGEDVVGTTDDHDQRFHRKRLDGKLNEAMNADGPKDMRVPWTMEGQSESIMFVVKRQNPI